ncbi:MAG: tRNA 2-selenouridine(34) synthase MnmH [Thiobacillaceae bacterium]|nr:tRNA 2-selenouridine(34) synthase MnmH [Thiobacillaceae bacterium]
MATLADIDTYDEIIDARSPGEYAEDHVPGAINLPVLDDAERARVGTLYKQDSPFAAKRIGAALVSRNIARHLEAHFADKPRHYRPLVYCWRGGSRSGAMTHVLRSVGWNAAQLEGGYKAYRRGVVADLQGLPERFGFVVVCGKTGVGKSRFLRALAELGAQVLDLEDLAAHMGSVLGAYPDRPQPPQKLFESRIWHRLRRFDSRRPVFVESESKKIGNLHTPEVLLTRMRASECLDLQADLPLRVALLQEEYVHFLTDPDSLYRQLDCLTALLGRERVARWKALAGRGDWDALVSELLLDHYDPAYTRSLGRNYVRAGEGRSFRLVSTAPDALQALARDALEAYLGH